MNDQDSEGQKGQKGQNEHSISLEKEQDVSDVEDVVIGVGGPGTAEFYEDFRRSNLSKKERQRLFDRNKNSFK